MKVYYLLIATLFSTLVLAQEKSEIERPVKKQEVPSPAIEWMKDAFEGRKKIKWHYEETSDKKSYEAKLKWEEKQYSVEFDTLGNIEDIEIIEKWEALSPELTEQLEKYFETSYKRYKIRKIQKQLSGHSDDLEDYVDENEMEGITIQYEIEFYGNDDNEKTLWEGLFDEKGKLLEKRKITLNPADNLSY
ncbi:MAG: hypothetical protein WD334_02325 [Chitinophagales bacterium]